MALSLTTDGGTLIIPGAYPSYKVQTSANGTAASGIMVLIGEADQGPDYSLEEDLELNAFAPSQDSEVISKYRSGPLVDAFYAAANPANDPNIIGGPSRVIMVKTNPSVKASKVLDRYDATDYATLADLSYGKKGNLINYQVTAKQSEVIPTTGSFAYIPAVGTLAYALRVNGGAALSGGTLGASTSPTAFVSAINGLAGVGASGGADRAAHPASGTIAIAVSGNDIVITTSASLAVTPTVGDTLVIPDASVAEGTSNANVGAYLVTAATANTISALKLSDAANPSAVIGTITAPTAVVPTALSGTPANDLKVYSPVTIALDAADPLDGVGKSLEIAELTSGTDLLTRCLFELEVDTSGDQVPVSWLSTAADPQLLTSASEYIATIAINRQSDQVSESLSAGGDVALKVSYAGTTASLVVDDSTLVITVAGGSGSSLSLDLSDYVTINDLATYINSQVGYDAEVGSGILGLMSPLALDDVTMGVCSSHGALNGRLKVDAFKFFKKIDEESSLVQLEDATGEVVQASSGLPAPMASVQYLANGAKGATTAAIVSAALTAVEKLGANFVVTCFSRDATDDIADGLTDSGSTYVIDDVNLAVRTHVNAVSTLKRRRNRQAIVSKRGTFAEAKTAAANLAAFRVGMVFQDVRALGPDGTVTQKQPYVLAAIAAGMQAAGVYRSIMGKVANVSGALQAEGDFDDRDDADVEDALLSGLLVLRREAGGPWSWVSDQTTYGSDSNFLYNSLANVYIADTISLTTAVRAEKAFKGQSISDVPAALVKSFMEALGTEFLRLKYTAASDDAPKGVKDIKVSISGNAAKISANWRINGSIAFITIDSLMSQVEQTA